MIFKVASAFPSSLQLKNIERFETIVANKRVESTVDSPYKQLTVDVEPSGWKATLIERGNNSKWGSSSPLAIEPTNPAIPIRSAVDKFVELLGALSQAESEFRWRHDIERRVEPSINASAVYATSSYLTFPPSRVYRPRGRNSAASNQEWRRWFGHPVDDIEDTASETTAHSVAVCRSLDEQ